MAADDETDPLRAPSTQGVDSLRDALLADGTAPAPEWPLRHAASGTVALVEDGAADVAAFRRVFREHGEVTAWASGEEALEALRAGRPAPADLAMLVVDINLPGIDGIEVIRSVRHLPGGANAAIFALSSRDDTETIDEALRAGADEYHVKPQSLADLRALVTDFVLLTADSAAARSNGR